MKLGLILTGGGTEVIGNLLKYGGASSYFSFAEVPYSKEASLECLCKEPKKYGSIETSNELMYAAMTKLWDLHPDEDLVGVGCSAVLYKDNQREGRENVAYITKLEYFHNTHSAKLTKLGVSFKPEKDITCDWSIRRNQEWGLSNIIEMLIKNDTTDIKVMCDKVIMLDFDWKVLDV